MSSIHIQASRLSASKGAILTIQFHAHIKTLDGKCHRKQYSNALPFVFGMLGSDQLQFLGAGRRRALYDAVVFQQTLPPLAFLQSPPVHVHLQQRECCRRKIQQYCIILGGSVAEWLACWTQAQKGLCSNRSRDAIGQQS